MNLFLAGASGGLGSQLVPFLEKNYTVIKHSSKNFDFTDSDAMYEMVNSTDIDILVNMVGVLPLGAFHQDGYSRWQKAIDVNLVGSMNLTQTVLWQMRKNGFGRIIHMSSVLVLRPEFGTAGYIASKAGLEGFVRAIALENAAKGITANCIALGYMDGGMFRQAPEHHQEKVIEMIPMKRPGKIEEIYNTIDWLVKTEYVTGQTIGLNGGLI